MKKTRSYVNNKGQVFYERAGCYNEVTKEAIGKFENGKTSSALKQENLAPPGNQSAAAVALRNVKKELGL